jgi:hypothetical protein
MRKFKKGDRVVLVEPQIAVDCFVTSTVAVKGAKGVIIGPGAISTWVQVRFDSDYLHQEWFIPANALAKEGKK